METAEATSVASSEIEVLACNWTTVEIYQRCQLTSHPTGVGVVFTGIAATEVLDAMRLCGLARREWDVVSSGVQLMGRVAAQAINAAVSAAPGRR